MLQLLSTEILHCSKLLQNIEIKKLCDISLYTQKILRSRAITCFDTSAILNLSLQGQQSHPILLQSYFKMALSASQDRDSHLANCTPEFNKCSKISYTNKDLFVFYLSDIHHQEIHEFDLQTKFYRLSSTHARSAIASHISCTFAAIISVASMPAVL